VTRTARDRVPLGCPIMLVANARMYSVDPVTTAAWRAVLEWVVARAGVSCEVIDYPAPLPLLALWGREDLGCAFMCGYPLMRANPPQVVLAAMVPSLSRYGGQPRYWSDLVVRADSALQSPADALGKRFAYTTEESQSGYQAPRRFFASFAKAARGGLFASVVGPLITPRRVLQALLDGDADIGALDSYAHDLIRRHDRSVTTQLRIVATTAPTPIPPLVAAANTPAETIAALRRALGDVAHAAELAQARDVLMIEGFVPMERDRYTVLLDLAREADALGYPRLA
jgi:ABC-type phosphate/phosphonate transport system substrate-binding protein